MSTEKITKNTNNFECEQCHYKCFKKSEWERHINTKKHKINKNDDFNNKKGGSTEAPPPNILSIFYYDILMNLDRLWLLMLWHNQLEIDGENAICQF